MMIGVGSKMVSSKVSLGTLGGGAVGIVTALVLAFIPAGDSTTRILLTALIPVILSAVGYFWTAYKATHKATAAEVEAAVADAERVWTAVHAAPAVTAADATNAVGQNPSAPAV